MTHPARTRAIGVIILLTTVLTQPATAKVGEELANSLWSHNAVARQTDGTVLALIPPGTLLVSRDAHPITLNDFADPIQLFREKGALSTDPPLSLGLITAGEQIYIISTTGKRLDWYRAKGPIRGDTKWEHDSAEIGEKTHVQHLAANAEGIVFALCDEAEKSGSASRLTVTELREGNPVTRTVRSTSAAISSARLACNGGDLEIVWVEAGATPGAFCSRLRMGDHEAAPVAEDAAEQGARSADIAIAQARTFMVFEKSDDSILARWRSAKGEDRSQVLKGRASHQPTLAVDLHGVVWLFAVGTDQRGLYYRRFLGNGFGSEMECGSAPGAWTLSPYFAVQSVVRRADTGFAIMTQEYLGENESPHFAFHNLPVPRVAAQDSRRVLLTDLLEIAELENLQQKVGVAIRSDANPLNLNGPLGAPDSGVAGYATVLHENGKFRMWYNGESEAAGRNWVICYAESDDGLKWTKPELGLIEYKGSKANNLLFPAEQSTSTPLIFKDEQETDPSRRYKMVLETYEGGTSVAMSWSADGLRWSWPPSRLWGKGAGKNKSTKGFHPWHEPLSSFFRDPLATHPDYLWKIYGQDIYAGYPNFDPNRRRNVCLVHGSTPLEFVGGPFNPVIDPRTGVNDDQIHGAMVQPYQGLYVALYQHWSGENWNVDLRLAVSRDGIHFARIQPQAPLLPLGASGAWDSGMVCTPNFLFQHDGRLWLYYRGSVGTLATGRVPVAPKDAPDQHDPWRMMTGLARLRLDGFAYLTIGEMKYRSQQGPQYNEVPQYDFSTDGRVVTIPIDADGIAARTLHINLENFAPGFAWVKAQIRDADTGNIVEGYRFEDSDLATTAALEHQLTWKGSPDLANVHAKRIRVEFLLHGTLDSPQLYSFWFSRARG